MHDIRTSMRIGCIGVCTHVLYYSIGGRDRIYNRRRGKMRYNLYTIILEEETGYKTCGGGRHGITYILFYWRKRPDIEPVEGEDRV